MFGLGFQELFVLPVIVGLPALLWRIFSRLVHRELKSLMQILTWSFVTAVTSCALLVVLGILIAPASGEPSKEPSLLEGICLSVGGLVVYVTGLSFYICLGILAKRLSRSWIVWVGLTIITTPIGQFVAYFRMRHLVNSAIQAPSGSVNP